MPSLFSTIKSDWDIQFSLEDFYHFKNFVLAVVSQFNAEEDSLRKISLFINALKAEYNIKHFTLNYDDLFVRILDYDKKVIGTSYEYLPSDWNFGDDTNQLTPSRIFYCDTKTPHCSLHLHGSVNYSIGFHTLKFYINKEDALKDRSKPGSYITEELQTGEARDWVPLIVGYEKDKILNVEPYSSIHLRMAKDLFSADEILMLGYSLSDEHVNKTLIKYSTPIDKPYATPPLKVKNIKIVDFKLLPHQIDSFIERFLTVGRQTGDPAIFQYNILKAEQYSEKVRFIQRGDFYLEFDFDGVDSFIDYYNTTKSLFRNKL